MFFTWKSNVGGNMKDALHMSIQRGKNVRRLVAVHCNMRSQFSLLHGVLDQLMYSLNCHWGSKSPWRFLYFVFIVKGAISAITQCNMVCVCVSLPSCPLRCALSGFVWSLRDEKIYQCMISFLAGEPQHEQKEGSKRRTFKLEPSDDPATGH